MKVRRGTEQLAALPMEMGDITNVIHAEGTGMLVVETTSQVSAILPFSRRNLAIAAARGELKLCRRPYPELTHIMERGGPNNAA